LEKKYINVMEEFVESIVTVLLFSPDFQLFCKCEKCRIDVISYSLNNLPNHYVTSEEGRQSVFTYLNQHETRQWINKRIIGAIYLVGKYPRH
jgi:competence protein ComFB